MEKKPFKMPEKQANAPEKKFIAGAVSATIWNNTGMQSDAGEEHSFQTISLSRNYKNKAGEWQSTNTLRINDLPKASIVLNKAYEYLTLKETNIY